MSRLEGGLWGMYLAELPVEVADEIIHQASSYDELVVLLKKLDSERSRERREPIFKLTEARHLTIDELQREAKESEGARDAV